MISDCTHWNITLTVAQRVNIKINNSSQTGIVVKQRRTRIVVNPIVVRRTGPYENRGNYGKSGQTGQWSNPDQPMPLTGQSEFQHAQVYRPAPQCAPRHHFCCTSPPCVRVYACARVRMSTGRKRRRRAAAKSAPPPVPAPSPGSGGAACVGEARPDSALRPSSSAGEAREGSWSRGGG